MILSDDGFTELLKNADDRVVLKTISNNRQHNINTAYALYPDWTDPILKRQTETTSRFSLIVPTIICNQGPLLTLTLCQ